MAKLFKMYGELFMEVQPQPWLIKASKTVKLKLADGQKFCVNVNTGALTVYNPENVQEDFVETKRNTVIKKQPRFNIVLGNGNKYTLSSDIETAIQQIARISDTESVVHSVVFSDQMTPGVGYTAFENYSAFINKVDRLYSRSHAMCK